MSNSYDLAIYRKKSIYQMVMVENITDFTVIANELSITVGQVSKIVNKQLSPCVKEKVEAARKAEREAQKLARKAEREAQKLARNAEKKAKKDAKGTEKE